MRGQRPKRLPLALARWNDFSIAVQVKQWTVAICGTYSVSIALNHRGAVEEAN